MSTLVRNFGGYHAFPGLINGLLNNFETLATESAKKTVPAVNIIEGDDNFRIDFVVPGFKKDDFKVVVHENSLKVSTEKSEEKEEVKEKFTHREFNYSSFERVFKLPNTVDGDAIEASYEDGILKISIPKKEEAKPKEQRLVSVN